ncbi:MAG: nitrile hydratase accessory protein [Candidatus Rokuibacteriota bacterium]
MSRPTGLDALPSLPHDDAGPVFREPWEAQAFAMAVLLHERGLFAWKEFAERLATAIAAARIRGEADDGHGYYAHWLEALEKLVTDKGLVLAEALQARKDEWDRAARATPHGQPVELPDRRNLSSR